jgi:redox-sensing transcriptional repressor
VSKIPDATITRLVRYLRVLERMEEAGAVRTSSEELARLTGVTAFQVRKDLAYFGSYGTRGVGYTVPVLRRELRQILGLGRRWRLILVGMGRLGQALADYPGLAENYELVAWFDVDPAVVGRQIGPVSVRPLEELEPTVRGEHVDVALLAVPEAQAQTVADRLVRAGIRGILNFAPVVLSVPDEVAVENVDFMAGLSRLGFFMLNPRWREEMMG